MKFRHFILIAILCFVNPVTGYADLKLPTKTFGGESYYYYKVKSKDTVEGIAKKLGISVDDILCYNPSASLGMAKKQLLFFPVDAFKTSKHTQVNTVQLSNEPVTHAVKNGETLYGIAKLYDMTVEELVVANPQAYQGVVAGDFLMIPHATGANSLTGQDMIYHTILAGESMYSVSKKYNTTIENLLRLNPGIYPNHFIEGEVLKIMPNSAEQISLEKDIVQFKPYIVQEGETYASIAKKFNLNESQLTQVNPKQKKAKKGKTIYIPKNAQKTTVVHSGTATTKELEQTYSPKMQEVFNNVHKVKDDNEINIALVLPFQLHKADAPRQAYLYTDFYKGFLLAVDSIGKKSRKKININVYDTQHNLNVTDSILALPQMKSLDVLVAPSEPKQLQRCNSFGKENGITVVNCFASKNDDYATNSRVLQINMPSSYMTAVVNSWVDKKFADYQVIFLEDPAGEDKDIYNDIKNHVIAGKKKYQTIGVSGKLSVLDLSQRMDPGSDYLFIPTSGGKAFLSKVCDALIGVKKQRFDCNVSMLGFPEYLTYLKDYKTKFQAIDTYIFSRFFSANEARKRRVEQLFKRKYNGSMIVTTPSMGLLGYDLGVYLISSLHRQGYIDSETPYFDGVQMDCQLKRASNWGGLINTCVELVHLKGTTMRESIIK